ncbi:MAG TPA: aminotransferase class I/II-fold pyridoxal phosphate-dependent enzyme [Stellaceae bacterium]|nr:aminotransferase class I/II-fold pyridoxal phosphate-dependent enzyme [Stellaceae bacterium]
MQDWAIHFTSDGLALSPAEYSRLLSRLAEANGIAADEFSLGGAVVQLEQRMAALLGKEAAVFMPSGTLANHLAVRLLARQGRRVLVQRESHLYADTGDCAQELSGVTLVPLAPERASFSLEEVLGEMARAEEGRVKTPIGAISIESPVRRLSGEVFDYAEMQRITGYARERGIGLHLDGARMFLAVPYTGIAPADYAAPFDTVYVSLYKYFNAAAGAILAGPRHLLDGLYHQRRMFGGGLRQAWPYAAVALHYLDGFEQRFAEAAAAANSLFEALGGALPKVRIMRSVRSTNVAGLRICGTAATSLAAQLRAHGISIRPPRRATPTEAEYELVTNETILRRPVDQVIAAFVDAIGRSGERLPD